MGLKKKREDVKNIIEKIPYFEGDFVSDADNVHNEVHIISKKKMMSIDYMLAINSELILLGYSINDIYVENIYKETAGNYSLALIIKFDFN